MFFIFILFIAVFFMCFHIFHLFLCINIIFLRVFFTFFQLHTLYTILFYIFCMYNVSVHSKMINTICEKLQKHCRHSWKPSGSIELIICKGCCYYFYYFSRVFNCKFIVIFIIFILCLYMLYVYIYLRLRDFRLSQFSWYKPALLGAWGLFSFTWKTICIKGDCDGFCSGGI